MNDKNRTKIPRNHTVNHNLFSSWNEISAYIFGFWLADGSIQLYKFKDLNKYQKRFFITNTDKQIISDISKIIGKEPNSRNNHFTHFNQKECFVIRTISNELFDFCYSITQSTTKSNKEIQLPNIPDKYFHHFVRGFFDGDGSIHIKHYKSRHGKTIEALQTSFTAGKDTGEFLENLKRKIQNFILVGNKKISCGVSKALRFNQYDSMLLCEWMYKDATLYMKRKKDIWDSCDKERLMNSKKYFSNKV